MKEFKFEGIQGYQEIKNELTQIANWYEDQEILNNPNIKLPKGVLLYGLPGNGKTLFVREFISNFDCPKFILEGKNKDTSLEIKRIFEKAKKEKFAIVVIDELELLIKKYSKEQRMLQQELDGIEQKGSILVLATANDIDDVGLPLKRPGRFDKLIKIDLPDQESRKLIFEETFKRLNANVKDVDFNYVSLHCPSLSCSSILAVCNDVNLRCYKKQITEEEIEKSYERVKYNNVTKNPVIYKDYRVAVHEAGHSLVALHFNKNWLFYKAKFQESGGITETQEAKEHQMSFEKKIQSILIGCGGFVAEKLVFGNSDYGSESDYEIIHEYCSNLIEKHCLFGTKYHMRTKSRANYSLDSSVKCFIAERKIHRLMKKFEKQTYSLLKPDIEKIRKFADLMMDKGCVTYRDVEQNGLN